MNSDGWDHSLGEMRDGNKVILGFEDIRGNGDWDFDDVVIQVELSSTGAVVAEQNLKSPDDTTQSDVGWIFTENDDVFDNQPWPGENDRIYNDGDAPNLDALSGDDLIYGDESANSLYGNSGHDVLLGHGGDDQMLVAVAGITSTVVWATIRCRVTRVETCFGASMAMTRWTAVTEPTSSGAVPVRMSSKAAAEMIASMAISAKTFCKAEAVKTGCLAEKDRTLLSLISLTLTAR